MINWLALNTVRGAAVYRLRAPGRGNLQLKRSESNILTSSGLFCESFDVESFTNFNKTKRLGGGFIKTWKN